MGQIFKIFLWEKYFQNLPMILQRSEDSVYEVIMYKYGNILHTLNIKASYKDN